MTDPTSSSGRPRRLAVLTDSVHPWNTGGKEVRHHELLTRLAAQGFEITVYTMKWWDGPGRIHRDGLTYQAICPKIPLYSGARRSIRQALVFALCGLSVVTRRFDVLEADAIPFLPLVPARIVAGVRRKPLVTTWHEFWGRDYWVEYLGQRGRLAAWVEAFAVRLPTRIIAASEGTAERLRASTPHQLDVVTIPNGVDALTPEPSTADERGAARSTAGGPGSAGRPLRLLTVGRLLDHKRVATAIDAVAVLVERGLDVRLTVIGEGPERERLGEQVSRLHLSDRVTLGDFLPLRSDLMEQMTIADLLVFPTVREGFGMVALEAMSVGTPVVTSGHPDNFARHLVTPGHNGQITRDGGAVALADAITESLRDLPAMRRAARASAERYQWESLAQEAAIAYGEFRDR